jgi:hypothetical protein
VSSADSCSMQIMLSYLTTPVRGLWSSRPCLATRRVRGKGRSYFKSLAITAKIASEDGEPRVSARLKTGTALSASGSYRGTGFTRCATEQSIPIFEATVVAFPEFGGEQSGPGKARLSEGEAASLKSGVMIRQTGCAETGRDTEKAIEEREP